MLNHELVLLQYWICNSIVKETFDTIVMWAEDSANNPKNDEKFQNYHRWHLSSVKLLHRRQWEMRQGG